MENLWINYSEEHDTLDIQDVNFEESEQTIPIEGTGIVIDFSKGKLMALESYNASEDFSNNLLEEFKEISDQPDSSERNHFYDTETFQNKDLMILNAFFLIAGAYSFKFNGYGGLVIFFIMYIIVDYFLNKVLKP